MTETQLRHSGSYQLFSDDFELLQDKQLQGRVVDSAKTHTHTLYNHKVVTITFLSRPQNTEGIANHLRFTDEIDMCVKIKPTP